MTSLRERLQTPVGNSADGLPQALVCLLLALFVSAISVAAILAVNGWDVSTLVRMSENDPISVLARQIEPGFSLGPQAVHYDGVYYYAIAIDPLATEGAHNLIDLAAHRYGHPAYGWLAWVASLGMPRAVPFALLALSLVGIAAGAFYTSLLSNRLGFGGGWGGLAVSLNPGLIFAVVADTSEALSMGVLAFALWLWHNNRIKAAALPLALLCFFKFQLLLVPLALGLWEIVRYLRGERDERKLKTLALLAIGPALFGLWQLYVHHQLGEWPTSLGPELLSPPPLGVFATMGQLGNIKQSISGEAQLVAGMLPILACIFVLFLVGLSVSLRCRTEFDLIFFFQALMVLSLNDWNLFFPKELIRVSAIPLVLLLPVLAGGGRLRPKPLEEPLKAG